MKKVTQSTLSKAEEKFKIMPSDTTQQRIGKRLKFLREIHEMGIQELVCYKFGVSPDSYKKYETGKQQPSYEFLELVAKEYKVSIDYLMGRTTYRNKTFDDIEISTLLGFNDPNTLEMLKQYKELPAYLKPEDDFGKEGAYESADNFKTIEMILQERNLINALTRFLIHEKPYVHQDILNKVGDDWAVDICLERIKRILIKMREENFSK